MRGRQMERKTGGWGKAVGKGLVWTVVWTALLTALVTTLVLTERIGEESLLPAGRFLGGVGAFAGSFAALRVRKQARLATCALMGVLVFALLMCGQYALRIQEPNAALPALTAGAGAACAWILGAFGDGKKKFTR